MVGKCEQSSNLTESEIGKFEGKSVSADKSERWSVDTRENYKKGCQMLVADM